MLGRTPIGYPKASSTVHSEGLEVALRGRVSQLCWECLCAAISSDPLRSEVSPDECRSRSASQRRPPDSFPTQTSGHLYEVEDDQNSLSILKVIHAPALVKSIVIAEPLVAAHLTWHDMTWHRSSVHYRYLFHSTVGKQITCATSPFGALIITASNHPDDPRVGKLLDCKNVRS